MTQQQIQSLLDRYLDGETTNAEEHLLRQYFAQTQLVPPEWRPYKALFAWETKAANTHSAETADTAPATTPHRRWRTVAAAVAALVLVGGALTATLRHQSASTSDGTQSYAVIDGHYTTDADLIAREAEQALLLVSTTEEETFEALNIFEL